MNRSMLNSQSGPGRTQLIVPNVINIGVRKCGTTSVYDWLAAHPEVSASIPKGTEFLLDLDSPYAKTDSNFHNDGLEGYRKYFRDRAGERVIFDGTTRYFEEATPCTVLANLDPQPHVFAVLREPADRAYSAFRYMQNNQRCIERSVSFSHFLQCIENGQTDELLAPEERTLPADERAGHQAEMAAVVTCGQYVDHLRRWREAFEPEKLNLYLFEDLKSSPQSFMEQVAHDIGIDADYYRDFKFKASNPTVNGRNGGVKRLERFARRLKPFLPKTQLTRALKRWYRDLRIAPLESRNPADETALGRLKEFYRPFNEDLASEFSLDLSAWNGS